MWTRRLLLLLSLYFAVDFADPYVISPVTAQVEDGEEEAVTTHTVRVKTLKASAPRRPPRRRRRVTAGCHAGSLRLHRPTLLPTTTRSVSPDN